MAIVTHDDVVKVVLLNSKTAAGDRNVILETGEETNVILNLALVEPIKGTMENYGDFSIEGKTEESDYSTGCNVTAVALFKGAVVAEALKLALKEVFAILNKNKVKVDIIYVNETNSSMTKLESTLLSLVIQNIMKDCKCNATLWMEMINHNDISTLSMDSEEKKPKKEKKKDKKDKDKKKKNKKKGKK